MFRKHTENMHKISYFVTTTLVLISSICIAQELTSPNSNYSSKTDFGDLFYIFCANNENTAIGSLNAESPFPEQSTFTWEKFDRALNSFIVYNGNISSDTLFSTAANLSDGCYRVTIESNGNSTQLKAWVLNNWINVTKAEIPDSSSNCEEFIIWADYEYAPLIVYNTTTGQESSVRNTSKEFSTLWYQNGELVRSYISPRIDQPIASNSPVIYNLIIEDEFGCQGIGSVEYISKVTLADFIADPMTGEAVLEVNFTNNSINYDSTIWFFYKDNFIISQEIKEAKGEATDSVDFILYENSPMHSYEMAGEYLVKLVTVKVNETGNCYDTLYMSPGSFINVDTTYIKVPNVFTPNEDGKNDVFVIETTSMRKLNIKIFNRWGGIVHSWNYSNIESSDYTIEHSVWDGKIGSRWASPGVYYYIIEYEGRSLVQNEESRRYGRPVKGIQKGFIHLFRGKN